MKITDRYSLSSITGKHLQGEHLIGLLCQVLSDMLSALCYEKIRQKAQRVRIGVGVKVRVRVRVSGRVMVKVTKKIELSE